MELAECRSRLRPQDCVLTARVEAEPIEEPLQCEDVVSPQIWGTVIEQAISDGEAALDERSPGFGADDAVNANGAPSLELADGGILMR